MTELSPARRVALDLLLELEETGAYARDALDASPAMRSLDRRDAGLAMRLVLGVVASFGCLDELIDTYAARPDRMDGRVREALRIAAFELVYLKREPRAAVSQGVELVRTQARGAAGFANAVLRRIAEDARAYLDAVDVASPSRRRIVSLARTGGLPVWLAARVADSIGFDAARELAASQFEPAPVAVHLNPLDDDAAVELMGLADAVAAAPAVPAPASPLAGALVRVAGADVVHSAALRRSGLAVCDLNAQLVATAALAPGSYLEVGSGRGTKTFVMAAQAARLGIERVAVALELSRKKTRLNVRRLERAGLDGGVSCITGNGCDLDRALERIDRGMGERALFSSVLVDAPCSGTGTMRRHPEIPWSLVPEDLETGVRDSLPGLQLALLASAAARVAPGGQLLYATCSVLEEEDEGVVDAFLRCDAGRAFEVAAFSEAEIFGHEGLADAATYARAHGTACGFFRSCPAPGDFDGHFCARLVRRA